MPACSADYHTTSVKWRKTDLIKMIHDSLILGERGSGSSAFSASHGPLLQNQGPRQRPDSSGAPRAKCKTSGIVTTSRDSEYVLIPSLSLSGRLSD